MKLYKLPITSEDVATPEPELILEDSKTDILKRQAESLARELGKLAFCWVGGVTDQEALELIVEGQCKFIVRPW